jgi:preprotein translocase subunit SecE
MEKAKLLLSALLLIAGIAGFYLLADKAMVLRILVVIAGFAAAIAVLSTSQQGKSGIGFVNASVAEAKRVVWPTRKETIQTTVAVFIMVVVMGVFLMLVDIGFAYMVQWIMGRSA